MTVHWKKVQQIGHLPEAAPSPPQSALDKWGIKDLEDSLQ